MISTRPVEFSCPAHAYCPVRELGVGLALATRLVAVSGVPWQSTGYMSMPMETREAPKTGAGIELGFGTKKEPPHKRNPAQLLAPGKLGSLRAQEVDPRYDAKESHPGHVDRAPPRVGRWRKAPTGSSQNSTKSVSRARVSPRASRKPARALGYKRRTAAPGTDADDPAVHASRRAL